MRASLPGRATTAPELGAGAMPVDRFLNTCARAHTHMLPCAHTCSCMAGNTMAGDRVTLAAARGMSRMCGWVGGWWGGCVGGVGVWVGGWGDTPTTNRKHTYSCACAPAPTATPFTTTPHPSHPITSLSPHAPPLHSNLITIPLPPSRPPLRGVRHRAAAHTRQHATQRMRY